mgnify:CR=1 FL=1|tara:strand:+ start:78 stop:629 length:552 start_codon:yes stop_codon:yes gene_type:complete
MKVLVGFEYSGRVRQGFTLRGHEAWSCDLLPTEIPGNHYQSDIREVLDQQWDLLIAFVPCTDLASSGARWFKQKRADGRQQASIKLFMDIVNSGIPQIAIENPIGIMSTHYRKPDQIIQPWQYGHGEVKSTCLWLKNLPLLQPTNIVEGREQRIWKMPPSKDRAKMRSLTYAGIAQAMAEQWG